MFGLDKNAPYILAIYGLGFACVFVSSLIVLIRARQARARLNRLEQQDPS